MPQAVEQPSPPRQGTSSIRRRRSIVAAAERIILRSGIDGLRAQGLADEADVSVATPYYYFPSLDDVILAAFARAADRASDRRAARIAASAVDAIGRLGALLTADFDGTDAAVVDQWRLRLEFQRGAIFDPRLRQLVQAAEHDEIARITALIAEAQAAGDAPPAPSAAALAHRLAALTCGLGSLLLAGIVTVAEARELIADAIADRSSWRVTAPPATRPISEPATAPTKGAERILGATLEVISRGGVGAVTFRSVATAAGSSLALPRYHFPTIARLVAAAFAYDERLARERIERSATQLADPRLRLRFGVPVAEAEQLAGDRRSQIVWLEYLRIAQHDDDARTAAGARLEAWTEYGLALGQDLAAIGVVPADRVLRTGSQRSVAARTGAAGLWVIGVLSDADYVAACNGVVSDELGLTR